MRSATGQECLLYTDGSTEEYYCSDFCDPTRCGEDEVCTLEQVVCVTAPCPAVITCVEFIH